MSLPTPAAVVAALVTLQAVAQYDRTVVGARTLFEAVESLKAHLSRVGAYVLPGLPLQVWTRVGLIEPDQLVEVTITDTAQANLTALITAVDAPVGTLFRVAGTGDSTDNALETAKGTAPAASDVFGVTSSSTVVYLGSWPA